MNTTQLTSKYHFVVLVKPVLMVRWVKHGSNKNVDPLKAGIPRVFSLAHGSKSKSRLTNLKASIHAWVNGLELSIRPLCLDVKEQNIKSIKAA